MNLVLLSRSTLLTQPGGDTLQLLRTAEELRKLGHQVDVGVAGKPLPLKPDVVHFFNLGRPGDYFKTPEVEKYPLVISTIFAHYLSSDQQRSGLLGVIARNSGEHRTEYTKTLLRTLKGTDTFPGFHYLLRGQEKAIRELLQKAQAIVTTSQGELSRIQHQFHCPPGTVVLPGVDQFPIPEPQERTGIICVARLELLKNQLNLIEATRNLNVRLTLVGAPAKGQPNYLMACKEQAHPLVNFVGPQTPEAVWNLLHQHQVHALPSFYETFGLSNLEAAFAGCHLVMGPTDAQEELKPFGRFCSPSDPTSIRKALEEALDDAEKLGPNTPPATSTYSWANAAKKLEAVYHSVL